MHAWYDFSMETFLMNHDHARASAAVINKHIADEIKILNNDYTKLILGGFSGGGITNFYVLFEQIQKRVGLMLGMACFPPDKFVDRIEQLSQSNDYQLILDQLRKVPIHLWYGEKDPFFVGKPTKTFFDRIIKACDFKDNFHTIEQKGVPHKISQEGLNHFYDLMLAFVESDQALPKL
ncbi:phospholipase carboxylesterase family protein [Stylonychia lemnae]|uniref:Phospholipase carboxylesterase family protein n=1 Tax=Stylonychia lemnae TaxID=5949 RepID=A0A078ACK7_STYLE|nr:phospholipase carboxylesterase family protein [Stylonychia lemnae]|eukprot:CDW79322.1 phospholipase carboxylesterase family protein [Stylonychia lemnae]